MYVHSPKLAPLPPSHFPSKDFILSAKAASLPKPYPAWKTCPPNDLARPRSLLLLLVHLYAIFSSPYGQVYERNLTPFPLSD